MGPYVRLVILSKSPEHSPSLGLLLVCSEPGGPQLPVCWHGVPAEPWEHEGTVLLLLLLLRQTLHCHWEQHHEQHCQKSTVTAVPHKSEPHAPDTKSAIFRATSRT